jgi:hypothetical protein
MKKFDLFNQLLTKLLQGFKHETPESREAEEYRKVKKEVRPLKTDNKFRSDKDNNQDISAI